MFPHLSRLLPLLAGGDGVGVAATGVVVPCLCDSLSRWPRVLPRCPYLAKSTRSSRFTKVESSSLRSGKNLRVTSLAYELEGWPNERKLALVRECVGRPPDADAPAAGTRSRLHMQAGGARIAVVRLPAWSTCMAGMHCARLPARWGAVQGCSTGAMR
jgi:hypothetical protein